MDRIGARLKGFYAEMKQYTIPNYEIIKKLGESYSTVVYKVHHKKNPNKSLVIKILKSQSIH